MIARDINLVVPLATSLLAIRWGRWILLRILLTPSVLFSALLLPRSPLHIVTFLSSFTRLAFPLLPRDAITRRAATPIDGFPLAFTIAARAAATTAATAAAAIHEKGIFGTCEQTRSKLKTFFSAILGWHGCGCGCG